MTGGVQASCYSTTPDRLPSFWSTYKDRSSVASTGLAARPFDEPAGVELWPSPKTSFRPRWLPQGKKDRRTPEGSPRWRRDESSGGRMGPRRPEVRFQAVPPDEDTSPQKLPGSSHSHYVGPCDRQPQSFPSLG